MGCKLSRFSRPAPTATVTAVKLSHEVMSGEAEEGRARCEAAKHTRVSVKLLTPAEKVIASLTCATVLTQHLGTV